MRFWELGQASFTTTTELSCYPLMTPTRSAVVRLGALHLQRPARGLETYGPPELGRLERFVDAVEESNPPIGRALERPGKVEVDHSRPCVAGELDHRRLESAYPDRLTLEERRLRPAEEPAQSPAIAATFDPEPKRACVQACDLDGRRPCRERADAPRRRPPLLFTLASCRSPVPWAVHRTSSSMESRAGRLQGHSSRRYSISLCICESTSSRDEPCVSNRPVGPDAHRA